MGSSINWQEVKELQKIIDDLWKQEEAYWSQRARLKWLEGGDRNSKFFHATTIQRRARNRIQRVKNGSGEWVEGKEEVFEVVLEHFTEVYNSDNPSLEDHYFHIIPSLVSDRMNEDLMSPVTESEIKHAAFSMGALKAPGPNGLNGLFYQRNWESVGPDITRASNP